MSLTFQINNLWFMNFNAPRNKLEERKLKYNDLIYQKQILFNKNLSDYFENSDFEEMFSISQQKIDNGDKLFFAKIPLVFNNNVLKILIIINSNIYLEIEVYQKLKNKSTPHPSQNKDDLRDFLEKFIEELFLEKKK